MTEPRSTLTPDLRDRAFRVFKCPARLGTSSELIKSNGGGGDGGDKRALVELAEFLEDTVVRALPVDARGVLRAARRGETSAVDALTAYGEALTPALGKLGEASNEAIVDELLERAVALRHSDAREEAPAVEAMERSSKRLKLAAMEQDVGAAISENGRARDALMALARTLGTLRAEDEAPTDALDACVLLEKCVAANERFVTPFTSVDGAEAARNPPSLDDVPSGVGLPDDATVAKAVSVARLLHVNDLRRLQSDVDAFLVSMQEYTADPKTDSRIGRVGR